MNTTDEYGGAAAAVRAHVARRWPEGVPLAYLHAYGCQQNVSDMQRLAGVLASLGFGITARRDEADLILLNTCAVRENAENRVYGNLGAFKALKDARPGLILAVCGCMTQRPEAADKIRRSYPWVDLVFGANAVHRLPGLLLEWFESGRVVDTSPPGEEIVEGLPVRRDSASRAWLPIMQGCDNFCTYCIVPYVRGRERSRKMEDIVAEARALVGEGYKEITLLGQNVNSYGRGADPADGEAFPRLLRALDAIEGDFLIRFMTSHPKDCSPALIDAVADCRKVERHIHLPVQSGSDRVLGLMNRRYTARQYLELIERARRRAPGVHFTSDVMVGFPGETHADFLETLALVRAARFTSLYTFLYSPRGGTKAAAMDDPVPAAEKQRWFEELLAAQEEISCAHYRAQVGRTLRVLAEGPGRAAGTLAGRAETGIIVQFSGPPERAGTFCDVRVTRALNWAVAGELADGPRPRGTP